MSFPRYPKYKDAGIEWLGEVPEDWEVKPIATMCRQTNEDARTLRASVMLWQVAR
jgi:type I restriction enzyme S subunit